MKKTAVVICSRCGGNKKLYGVRTEKKRGIWYFTWAFKLKEDVAKREGFLTTKIDGTDTETDNTYPGCPYCGKKGLYIAGNVASLPVLMEKIGLLVLTVAILD